MRSKPAAAHAKDIEAFIRFEEGLMLYLFSNGHLSAALRPLWEERLHTRMRMPAASAFPTHMTALRDCVEMARDWNVEEVRAADQFLTSRGAPTLSQIRVRCHRFNPKWGKPRSL